MATQLQLRRGTTSENGSFTGALGEVTVDTDKDTLVVHDGATAGGHEMAKKDGSNMTAIDVGDNVRLKMGNDDDLLVYHDGSNSRVQDSGTGALLLRGTNLKLQDSDGYDYVACEDGGGEGGTVKLKHNNQQVLATTSGGCDITGSLSADGAILSGNLELNYAYPRIKLTDTDNNSDYSIINNNGEFGIFDDTNNGYRLNVSASGDVSIPNGNLNVSGSNVTNGCRVQFTNAAASKVYQVGAGQAGISNNGFVIRNVTDNTFPLVIDDNSNVSIPSGNLDVTGSVTADAGSYTSSLGGNSLTFSRNGENFIIAEAGTSANLNIKAGNKIVSTTDNYHAFNTGSGAGTEAMRLDSSQNVSIPNGDLSVGGVGSIGTSSGDLAIFSTDSGHEGLRFGNGAIVPTNNSGGTTDNACGLGTATGRFSDLHLAGGVYLGGTAAGNKLDDYEEGTWTPVLAAVSGTQPTISQSNVGYYTKVGRLVTLTGVCIVNSISGTTSGLLQMSGIPFTIESGNGYHTTGAVVPHELTFARPDNANLSNHDTVKFGFLTSNNGSGWGWETMSILTATSQFRFSLSYYTSQ